MTKRLIAFGLFTICAITLCIRLGIWQLHRLSERRGKNAMVWERGKAAPLPMAAVRNPDTAATHWRRVIVHGVPDYAAEVVQTSRSQSWAPGVYLLTPVRPLEPGWGDTAILVLRGYLYAPNGRTADFVKAQEGDTLTVETLVTTFPPTGVGAVQSPTSPRAVRFLNRDTLSAMMQRPLAPVVLLALGDTVTRDVTRPARVPTPPLGDGPHLSYALQWFGFAIVFLVGFLAFAFAGRTKSEDADAAR